jgi:hypothetical protein
MICVQAVIRTLELPSKALAACSTAHPHYFSPPFTESTHPATFSVGIASLLDGRVNEVCVNGALGFRGFLDLCVRQRLVDGTLMISGLFDLGVD